MDKTIIDAQEELIGVLCNLTGRESNDIANRIIDASMQQALKQLAQTILSIAQDIDTL